jgi:PAS domain S-box-containing protein
MAPQQPEFVFTVYSGLFFTATLISLFTAILAWQRKSMNGARELLGLMIAAAVWTFFNIFEAAATESGAKVFWSQLNYLGAVSTPVLYLIFVMRFTGRDKWLIPRNRMIMFIIPVITFVLAATNEYHHLIWSGFSSIAPKTNIMVYHHGIGFWIGYMAYNYLMLAVSTVILIRFITAHSSTLRSQAWFILVACLCPWIASVLYLTDFQPISGLDLVPLSIILSGVLFTYSMFYRGLLHLSPIARETLMETITDGILVLDRHNRIQDINNAAATLLGLGNKKVLGQYLTEVDLPTGWLKDILLDPQTGPAIQVKSPDGSLICRISKKSLPREQGSFLFVIRDITSLIQQEDVIRAAEERYRSMFTMFRLMADNMPDMLWAKDLDKNFIFTNKAICDNLLHAHDTEETIGKSDLFFALRERQTHPDHPEWHTFGEMCRDSDQVVMNSGKAEHFDEFGNVFGKFLFLDVRKAPIFDHNGVMIGVVGSARDVTRQRRNEEEINKRDQLLGAIASATALLVQHDDLEYSINGALGLIGTATSANRVYIFQNSVKEGSLMPLMSQRYEWTDGRIEPQIDNPELQDLPYETACPRWFEILSAGDAVVGNISDFPETERSYLEPQGIKSILVTPVFIDKNFWGFIGFDDCFKEREWPVTEQQILSAAADTIGAAYTRKKSQEELMVAKERAEESDRLKSAFLANMSHEIRTPMNGILGFAELLKEPDLTGDEQMKYISIIEKSGSRMLNIINDLVDISKLEAGQVEVVLSETNIFHQMEYIYNFFKPEAESKGIKLGLKSDEHLKGLIVLTDKEKVYAILTNLVKNAIRYTEKGYIEFGCCERNGKVEYFVKDTGIGIEPAKQETIFNRFVQANTPSGQARQGAGLGLSIARAYVELLGGNIWLESTPGVGSVFSFTIPEYNR